MTKPIWRRYGRHRHRPAQQPAAQKPAATPVEHHSHPQHYTYTKTLYSDNYPICITNILQQTLSQPNTIKYTDDTISSIQTIHPATPKSAQSDIQQVPTHKQNVHISAVCNFKWHTVFLNDTQYLFLNDTLHSLNDIIYHQYQYEWYTQYKYSTIYTDRNQLRN